MPDPTEVYDKSIQYVCNTANKLTYSETYHGYMIQFKDFLFRKQFKTHGHEEGRLGDLFGQ